jgi:hypothetical protein
MTHPFAIIGHKNGGNSGGWNEVHAGDHVIYLIDGRTGTLDECLHDGEAYVTWDECGDDDDGLYGTVKWFHLAPVGKVRVFDDGRWERK